MRRSFSIAALATVGFEDVLIATKNEPFASQSTYADVSPLEMLRRSKSTSEGAHLTDRRVCHRMIDDDKVARTAPTIPAQLSLFIS